MGADLLENGSFLLVSQEFRFGVGVEGIVHFSLLVREVQVADFDVLLRKRYDGVSVLVFHRLFAPEDCRRKSVNAPTGHRVE